MNKGVLIFLFVLAISFASAVQYIRLANEVQYACPSGSQINSGTEEIDEGHVESVIAFLPVGICGASESAHFGWIEATIFLDANVLILENSSTIRGAELVSGNSSVSYTNITGDNKAGIKVGSSSTEMEVGDCSQVGSGVAVIKSIVAPSGPVEVMVATKGITLNTKKNPSEIIELNSKKYAVQLLTGSYTESTVRVSTCSSGDIYEIAQNTTTNTTNSTTPANSTNSTIPQNNTTNSTTLTNQTQRQCPNIGIRNGTNYCNPDGQYISQKAAGQACYKNYECVSNYCNIKESLCEKKGLFRGIWDWFKGLFS